VVTRDGQPLVQPTLLEVANAVGLSTTAQGEFYDVVIIGSGPAGLGAAVYAASEGLKTVVVERAAAGGQAGKAHGSRTTSVFPTVCPVISSPIGRAGRPCVSGPSC
jgi:thioredoxin reductase (NADPH)